MYYFVKTPFWLSWIYPKRIWRINTREKKLYLSFDDGPHPRITPLVLDLLKAHEAKASFFCIGNNVEKYPEVYARIIEEGHTVGNHTQNHLNGWKTEDETYFNNITSASRWIDSKLFRPPYGRMTLFQEKLISKKPLQFKTIMWTILSGDFDMELDWNDCHKNIERNLCKGAIIVFHDSEKAEKRMIQALEQTLKKGKKDGWVFESLPKM